MINVTPEGLAAMAANALPTDPPPTEAQVDDFLARMAVAFQVPAGPIAQARKVIHARFAIRMELGEALTSNVEHAPWLDARRASIDPFYWSRYREFLVGNGWPPLVTATLDRATDEFLDLLGDPAEPAPWKRRGLAMGDVQSGKTATHAALICKAADAGYRMIILLTGMLENVRRQTQERLDAAFIGFDSSDFLDRLVTWARGEPFLRMLQVPELMRAMGFGDGYDLAGIGTRRDRIRLLGNGVASPVMEAIVRSLITGRAAVAAHPSPERTRKVA
jgi:hypothetical protein